MSETINISKENDFQEALEMVSSYAKSTHQSYSDALEDFDVNDFQEIFDDSSFIESLLEQFVETNNNYAVSNDYNKLNDMLDKNHKKDLKDKSIDYLDEKRAYFIQEALKNNGKIKFDNILPVVDVALNDFKAESGIDIDQIKKQDNKLKM